MNNSVNFHGMTTDHAEDKVGFNDENAISISCKFFIFGYPAKMWVGRESADPFV